MRTAGAAAFRVRRLRRRHEADDLVQGALERVYMAWPRACRASDPGAYLRTVLARLAISESRRAFRRRELPASAWPAGPDGAVADHGAAAGDRVDLAAALRTLTAKQRAVVALRYLEDRSVAEVAEILGIAQGTVKRQSHDAMTSLRRHLTTPETDIDRRRSGAWEGMTQP